MSKKSIFIILFFLKLYAVQCPDNFIEMDDVCYYKKHIDVLQDFIDVNTSLTGLKPQNIGGQEWQDGMLHSLYLGDHLLTNIPDSIGILSTLEYLDLQKNRLITLPEGICNIYSSDASINFSENNICPPYPYCIDYLGDQNISKCQSFECAEKYININNRCYYKEHIHVLQKIIDYNEPLHGLLPLDIGKEIGYQNWKNGKLRSLSLINSNLTILPEDICGIFSDLHLFDVSNNAICPPYPSCFEYIGYQHNTECTIETSCPDGYVAFSEKCYYNTDLQVLRDFISINPEIKKIKPIMLGVQKWEAGRIRKLNLEKLSINNIPQSIGKLDSLKYINLKDNQLESLPTELCDIYSNLQYLDLSDNFLCSPYPECFMFIGNQKISNCSDSFCMHGYTEINGDCYYEKDLRVLQDFIDNNISLSNKNPLEIGLQKWENMRLDYLYLGANNLTVIPESLCDIYTNLSIINISKNNICPPYPDCILEYIGQQNTSKCP